MPPGSLEMSLRSRASSAAAEILVLAAICRSEIPRRSRARRSFPPKSSICAATLDNLRKRCQTHEEFDRGKSRGAGVGDLAHARSIDAADRDHRQGRARTDGAQRLDAGDAMRGRLAGRRKDGAEEQVVAAAIGDGGVNLVFAVHGAADDEPL